MKVVSSTCAVLMKGVSSICSVLMEGVPSNCSVFMRLHQEGDCVRAEQLHHWSGTCLVAVL